MVHGGKKREVGVIINSIQLLGLASGAGVLLSAHIQPSRGGGGGGVVKETHSLPPSLPPSLFLQSVVGLAALPSLGRLLVL